MVNDPYTKNFSSPVQTDLPPLWEHQRKALEMAGDRFALFFDPGCGKTRTAIELIKRPFGKSIPPKSVVIFAPLNVCRNWRNELQEYLREPYMEFMIAGQTKGSKLKMCHNFRTFSPSSSRGHVILICNLETLRFADYREALGCGQVDTVIVDEAHYFKNHGSAQTKGLFDFVRKTMPKELFLLTGTPAPQGEMDLWAPLYLLEQTRDPFFMWRKKHFDDKNERRRGRTGYWPEFVIREKSRQLFRSQLDSVSLTAKKDECLDLPPLLKVKLFAELSKEQKKHYESMSKFLFAIDSAGNEAEAENFLTRTLRLQQIICGALVGEHGNSQIIDNARLEVLKDAIEMIGGESFIVWTIFKFTYAQIGAVLDELGISFGSLTGEQSAEERAEVMEAFQSGKLRALIAHPRAGGVGVNLTAASYSIHYSRSFSLTDDMQAEARNYRGGSERHKKITRIDIISPATIDEDIASALEKKKTLQDFILGVKEKFCGQKER